MTTQQIARLGVFHLEKAIISVLENSAKTLEPSEISKKIGIPVYHYTDRTGPEDAAIVQGILAKLQQEKRIQFVEDSRWKLANG